MPKRYYNRTDAFWANANKTDGCWLWSGAKTKGGYGQMRGNTGTVYAHRFAYELLLGLIPKGLQIDHLCRVRHCVNPKHMETITQQENIKRGEGGRHWREKTHCPQKHEYSKKNTYINPKGSRVCRECSRIRNNIMRGKL